MYTLTHNTLHYIILHLHYCVIILLLHSNVTNLAIMFKKKFAKFIGCDR